MTPDQGGEGRLAVQIRAALTRGERGKFLKFLAVGGLNTLVGYGLFAGFILMGAPSFTALAGSTMLGVLFNFKSIGKLVFRSGDPRRLPRFVAVYAVQFLVNLGGLHALQAAGLSPLVAQLILLPLLAIGSFLAMRRFVFAA